VNNPLVQVDPGLFIWTILTFLGLAALLAKFAWKPLLAALAARQATIAKSLEDAREARQELERVKQDSAKILAEARVEAESIISRTRSDAERLRAELREKASADAANIRRDAERQIQVETKRAIEEIRREAVDLSVAIAGKLLRRNVSAADNEALIADAIRQIDAH
jgi:F-type H+-transporting ATPase subunit b